MKIIETKKETVFYEDIKRVPDTILTPFNIIYYNMVDDNILKIREWNNYVFEIEDGGMSEQDTENVVYLDIFNPNKNGYEVSFTNKEKVNELIYLLTKETEEEYKLKYANKTVKISKEGVFTE